MGSPMSTPNALSPVIKGIATFWIEPFVNGSVVSWQHINLLDEYDFSDEKLLDF
jgi:hypothetical protein